MTAYRIQTVRNGRRDVDGRFKEEAGKPGGATDVEVS